MLKNKTFLLLTFSASIKILTSGQMYDKYHFAESAYSSYIDLSAT